MDSSPNTITQPSIFSEPRNIFIFALLLIVILMFVGINLFSTTGKLLDSLVRIFKPLITSILGLLGYTTGSIINKSADVVGEVGRFGLDIAEGTVQDVGGIIKNASSPYVNDLTKHALDSVLTPKHNYSYLGENKDEKRNDKKEGFAEATVSQIQCPNTSRWSLLEENGMVRTSVDANEQDVCPSGQIYPFQKSIMKLA